MLSLLKSQGGTFTRGVEVVGSGDSNASYENALGATVRAKLGHPRPNFSSGINLGLLIEEQRTNSFLNSTTLATQGVTVTAQAYTVSFKGTGTITFSNAHTGSLVGTGANDKVSVTFTPTAGTVTCTVSGTVEYANFEAGSFATSWIYTAGTTVTRGAETSNRLSATDIINQTEGTLYAKLFVSSGISKASRRILSINEDSLETNSVLLRLSVTNQPQLVVFDTTLQAVITGTTVSGLCNIIVTYKKDEIKLFVNGTKIGQDLSASLPPFNKVDFSQLNGVQLSDPLSMAILYPKALPDADIELLTRI
jgi:hypothetical protein